MDQAQRLRELFDRYVHQNLLPAEAVELVSLLERADAEDILSEPLRGVWEELKNRQIDRKVDWGRMFREASEMRRESELGRENGMRRDSITPRESVTRGQRATLREIWGWRAVAAFFFVLAGLAAYWSVRWQGPLERSRAATKLAAGVVKKNGPREYFVSQDGGDGQDGSRAHPWRSVTAVSRTALGPGDSVFLHGGQIFSGTLKIGNGGGRGGTVANPVWIGSYGGGEATIDGADSSALVVYQAHSIIVHGLRLVGSGRKTGNIKDGLAIIDSHDIRVTDVDITGFQKSGLFIYASTAVVAERVYAHENGAAGIAVEGPYDRKTGSRDLKILYCRADDNPGDPTNLTNHSGNGIVCGHCTNLLIDHCSATNNGWDMPRIGNGPVGIWCYEADSVTIEHCLAYRNKTSAGAADGGGFDFDGGVTHSVIQYCLSYGNQGSGYCIFQYWGASPWHDNVIRWNISEDDGLVSDSRAGMYVWNSSNDPNQFYNCKVYNNTV
ncbi:MAG TPA: right-handed parallel beta-helix repeat-containing protein, partial [Puia sp.]|nr:right-handed parallel beta-helix repeat-containing protein [Puia sp.]